MSRIRYNEFYSDIVRVLYFENRLQDGAISFKALASRYGIKYERGYLAEAARELRAKGLLRGPEPMAGDDTAIGRLTGAGLRFAEDRGLDDLIEEDHDTDLTVKDAGAVDELRVPASDRIVQLGHNQIQEVDNATSKVIQAVSDTNGDPEDPSFRQRILGQLKAGRELLRAGEFKVYVLEITLVSALRELICRYGDGVIAGLATNLLQYILTHKLSGN